MKKTIVGVDEVGRGSLIGPVFAAAVIFKKNLDKKKFKSIVICRKDGPIINKYKKINIEAIRLKNLYSYSAKPSINNFKLFLTTLPDLIFFINGFLKILKIIKKKKSI